MSTIAHESVSKDGEFSELVLYRSEKLQLISKAGYHGDLESHALLSEDVLLWDATVFKDELAGGGGLDTQFVFFLAQR